MVLLNSFRQNLKVFQKLTFFKISKKAKIIFDFLTFYIAILSQNLECIGNHKQKQQHESLYFPLSQKSCFKIIENKV